MTAVRTYVAWVLLYSSGILIRNTLQFTYLILFQVRMNEDIHTCICHERSNKVIISEVLCNNEQKNYERIRSFVRTLRTFVRTKVIINTNEGNKFRTYLLDCLLFGIADLTRP